MGTTAAKPEFAATLMGAVPYKDIDYAAKVILNNFSEAPRIPIMTMSIRWVLEGIPCIVIDREKKTIFMVPPEEREEEVLSFYENIETDDLEHFAVSEERTPSFVRTLETIRENRTDRLKWLAFQVPGPVVIADSIRQVDKSPAIHHETMRDMLTRGINMRSRWMEQKIREMLPGVEVICDHPEPSLVSFTSAGGSGSREDLIHTLREGFRGFTGLSWVHCCANIDWTLLTDTGVDIINFDAYKYADKAALYAKEFDRFIDKGGMIGWGIVPVMEDLLKEESVHTLFEKLENGIQAFTKGGIDEEKLARASWVLPSCETILLPNDLSDHVFEMTREISDKMKEKYGFA